MPKGQGKGEEGSRPEGRQCCQPTDRRANQDEGFSRRVEEGTGAGERPCQEGWHSTKTQPKEQITTVGASSRSEGLTFCIVWYNNTIQLQRRRKMARQLDVMVVRIPPEVKKNLIKGKRI